MGWLDFFKKHQDALLKGAGQGLQASQNDNGIGANIGNALGGFAVNKVASRFNQEDKPDYQPLSTDMPQQPIVTDMHEMKKPAGDWQSVLSGMSGQQEQTQPVTWQTILSQKATPMMPEENTMFAAVGDPLKKNTALSPYEQAKNNVMEISNRSTDNQDHGWKGWLKEFASNVGGNFNKARQLNPNAGFLENLGAGLGGGAIGGTIDRSQNEVRNQQTDLAKAYQQYGIQNQIRDDELRQEFNRAKIQNVYDDNKRQDAKLDFDKEKVKAKVEQDTAAFNRRMEILDKQQTFAGNQWEKYIDGSGKVFKQYKDGRLEPVIGLNGEQDTDPSKVTYEVYDPITKQNIRGTGGQILGYSGMIQQGDANREQQAKIKNAEFDIETQKTNVKNAMDYNNQVVSLATEASKQSGKLGENLAEMNGYNEELQTTTQEISTVDPDKDPDRYNKLVDKINNLSGKVIEAAGKTESGARVLQDLRARGVQPPQLVKAPKVQAVKVNSGKPVPKSKDPLNLFQ